MTDNEALRYILAELRLQNRIALGHYVDIAGSKDYAVSDSVTFSRNSCSKALKTVITKQGNSPCLVFENTKLVKILPAKETWISPLNGGGYIQVKCDTGLSTTVAIATYRCA